MSEQKSFTNDDYQILNREILYQGIFRLVKLTLKHRLFKGEWSTPFTREVLERSSAAAILPYDPVLDRVILIEQFRPGPLSHSKNPWLIEIPAGVFADNESPEALAIREAHEEAGCHITELHPICDYFVSPGGTNEYLYLFCGKVDASDIHGIHGLSHENEDIRVLNLTVNEALDQLYAGKIKTSPALLTLLWLQLHRTQLQKKWL